MKGCPNCGRGTARTEDWACQWCGYPLLGSGYKTVPKTFRELQEERGYLKPPLFLEQPEEVQTEPEPEPMLEEVVEEAAPHPEPEPEPMTEEAAPQPEPVSPPQDYAEEEILVADSEEAV
ncbi:hypothetical protein ACFLXH_06010, partial [Chloroflexota bacterium]